MLGVILFLFWILLFVLALIKIIRAWSLLEMDGDKGLLMLLLVLLLPFIGPIIALAYIPSDLDAYRERVMFRRVQEQKIMARAKRQYK